MLIYSADTNNIEVQVWEVVGTELVQDEQGPVCEIVTIQPVADEE